MTFKRSYEISPLPIGHPVYELFDNPKDIIVYEIVITEDNHTAILYRTFTLTEEKEIDFSVLEDADWDILIHATAINTLALIYAENF